jgi:hypothetical protein
VGYGHSGLLSIRFAVQAHQDVRTRLDSSSEVLDKGNVVLGQNDLKKLVDIKPSIWCIA